MSNTLKDYYDKASVPREIADRIAVIQEYQRTGCLDRNRAIELIIKLRTCDKKMAAITIARKSPNSIPLDHADNQGLVAELQFQVNYLMGKGMTDLLPKNHSVIF